MINSFQMEKNDFLHSDIDGFFHTDFYGANHPNNPNFLYKLKNDPHHNWTTHDLASAASDFRRVILSDLPQILRQVAPSILTVCIVPRAKAEAVYRPDQLLFKSTLKDSVRSLPGFQDGVNFIVRHTNTRTTHLRKPVQDFENDGRMPYAGIAIDTCDFSHQISGRDILLVDDVYTKTVNIDEDMVQALFKNGAKSVVFYAVGKTARRL